MTGCGRVALPQAAADLLWRTQALLLALFPAADQKAEEQVLFHSDPELALRHYGNAILRTAYTYLRNRSDAEDVVQDTLVQLLVADPGFESPAHEKAWLLRVAINLSKNKLRQAQRHGCQSIDESFPGLAPEEEDLSFVWEAVSGLPERYREVIHLFLSGGLLHGTDRPDPEQKRIHRALFAPPGPGAAAQAAPDGESSGGKALLCGGI